MALLPGRVSPRLVEELVHLATWMPFAQAAQHLKRSTRVDLSEPTVRRQTQAAGAAYVAVQTQAAQDILQHGPPAPSVSAPLVVSVDGAMVPLRRGEWAEVKTLVVGAVDRAVGSDLHTLSYFSRLSDAATFGETAVVETHRRGVPGAREVAAVVDGAEWIQGFLDLHCPDAIRILDFPHAAEHISQLGHAALGSDSATVQAWLVEQLHALKHTGPAEVLATLRGLVPPAPASDGAGAGDGAGVAGADHLAYLEKRVAQLQYPAFAAAGWPLGSGVVESANKVVVAARLKGAGMRWARGQVNGMVALRTIVYSDRWEEAWPQIVGELRRQAPQGCARRRQQRRERRVPPPLPAAQPVLLQVSPPPAVLPLPSPSEPAPPVAPHHGSRPAADHPWRRAWSRRQQAEQAHTA